jgi:hypothetical protein
MIRVLLLGCTIALATAQTPAPGALQPSAAPADIAPPQAKDDQGGFTVSTNYDPHGGHIHAGATPHMHDASFSVTPIADSGEKNAWATPELVGNGALHGGNQSGLVDTAAREGAPLAPASAQNAYDANRDEMRARVGLRGDPVIRSAP